MQNKPNLRIAQMNINKVLTKEYENARLCTVANAPLCQKKHIFLIFTIKHLIFIRNLVELLLKAIYCFFASGINRRKVWRRSKEINRLNYCVIAIILLVAHWSIGYAEPAGTNLTTAGNSALLKYKALLESTGGETTVYYDYVENGRLQGGRTTIILPPLPDKGFMKAATLWNVTTIVDNGPTSNRIDIVFVGDGYTAAEMVTYANHTYNVLGLSMAEEPIAAYSTYFNIHRVDVIYNESGVDEPDLDIYRDTALDMTYNCSGIARLLCVDVSKAILAAGNAPDVDQTLALANSTRYGGAGYSDSDLATLAGDNSSSVEIALHEFGHSFANLADEYDYDDGCKHLHSTGAAQSADNMVQMA